MAVRISLTQLQEMVDRIEYQSKHGMKGTVLVSIQKHPNGEEYVEFEQESVYAECFSSFHRF
nr:hypothetical protein [uncultured Anaeromusa sp.]